MIPFGIHRSCPSKQSTKNRNQDSCKFNNGFSCDISVLCNKVLHFPIFHKTNSFPTASEHEVPSFALSQTPVASKSEVSQLENGLRLQNLYQIMQAKLQQSLQACNRVRFY